MIFPFLFSFLLFFIWFLSSKINNCAVSPAALFSGLWFFECIIISILTTVSNHSNSIYFPSYSLITLFVLTVFFASDGVAIYVTKNKKCLSFNIPCIQYNKLTFYYSASTTLGIFYSVVLLIIATQKFGTWNLLIIPGMVAHAKYLNSFFYPFYLNYFLMFIFISAILGGFISGSHTFKRPKKLFHSIWILPSISCAYLNASRSAFAIPVVFWLSSYIGARAYVGKVSNIKVGNTTHKILIFIFLAFLFVHLGYMVRVNVLDFNKSKDFFVKSLFTMFGSIPVMDDWIQSGGLWSSKSETIYTFAGTAQLIGLGKREKGLYQEKVTINYGTEHPESNIYTSFRTLIDDFSLAGAIFLTGCISFFTSVSWIFLRKNKIWGYPLVLVYNSFVLWSPITSTYIYNSTIGAVVIGSTLIIYSSFRNKQKSNV